VPSSVTGSWRLLHYTAPFLGASLLSMYVITIWVPVAFRVHLTGAMPVQTCGMTKYIRCLGADNLIECDLFKNIFLTFYRDTVAKTDTAVIYRWASATY
jgi:hypothetical protein